MVALYSLTVPPVLAVYLLTPADLWVLPAWLTASDWRADLLFATLVYVAGFFGGILQLYNLSDRGFSLRILIDIDEAPDGRLDLDGVMAGYSAGRGIRWMYRKRLDDMVSRRLIVADPQSVILTKGGRRTAEVFSRLRKILQLDETRRGQSS
jgi:hypothetical protein